MAKRTNVWWPYAVAGVVVLGVVAVAATQNRQVEPAEGDVGTIVENAQDAAQYRAAEQAAKTEAATHAQMADYHADAAVSASNVGGAVEHGAKAVGEKVQEGVASVKEGYNGAMADYNNQQMMDAISQTMASPSTAE
ncbi:MAG: hypothetical protein GC129_05110 [Proteobacteria bacterium]|nr:hypothetical protein [Pseudomonadota bacterium]